MLEMLRVIAELFLFVFAAIQAAAALHDVLDWLNASKKSPNFGLPERLKKMRAIG
jgi:hypothetical protein